PPGRGPPVAGQLARCRRRTAARRQQRRSRRRPPPGELRLGPRGSRAALPALRRRLRTGRVRATRASGTSGRHGLRGPYAPHPRVPQDPPAGSAAAAGPAASRLGGTRSVRALPPPLRARVRTRGRLPVGHRAPAAPPAALGTLRRVCTLRGIGAHRAPLHPFDAGRSGPTAAPALSAPAGQPPVSATSIRFTGSTPLVLPYVPSPAIARTAVMPGRSPASAATKSAKEVNESTLWLPPGATCAIANVIGPVVLGTKLSPVDTVAGSSCSGPIR